MVWDVGRNLIEKILNQHVYLRILETIFSPFVNTFEPDIRDNLFWQQPGAAQSTVFLWKCLDHQFAERRIGRLGPIRYPSRSPDTTPFDFFLRCFKTQGLFERFST